MKFQAAVLSVLVLYFQQGDAIKCYVCTSATNAKCGDPIDTSLEASECTPSVFQEGAGMLKSAADSVNDALGKLGFNSNLQVPDSGLTFSCVKAVRQDGDKKAVVRGCSVAGNDQFDVCKTMKAQQGGLVTFCENCTGDKCNGATELAPVLLVTLLTSCLAIFLSRQ